MNKLTRFFNLIIFTTLLSLSIACSKNSENANKPEKPVIVTPEEKAHKTLRWTEAEDKDSSFSHILSVINQKTSFQLSENDFIKIEERDLATSHYTFYAQTVGGTPVHGSSIRIWSDLKTKAAIQVEVDVEKLTKLKAFALEASKSINFNRIKNSIDLTALALKDLENFEDKRPALVTQSKRFWKNGELVQIVKIKSRRGYHNVTVSIGQHKVIEHNYTEFPQKEALAKINANDASDEYSLRAFVYPIYEEAELAPNQILERKSVRLSHLKKNIRRSDVKDPYASLRTQRYFYDQFDPILGMTEAGRAKGFWAMNYIKSQASKIKEQYPFVPNDFENEFGGTILEGRYATINIHPDAMTHFPNINFKAQASLQFRPAFVESFVNGKLTYEMVPGSALLGRPITSHEDILTREARRLPDHDPATYINDGFDEIQVYYSINTLMESLQSMGFTDPELSTRPFNAFLFDPDISMRDNAYYTDDTINFTTYSPKAINYARDNSTIWHELGHGIMDRLMGDSIVLADTGGLSEGMADFVASLVIADKLEGEIYPGMNDYRIINNTGFHLTNEVHDDGESYGGSMDDLKNAAIARDGREGLRKVTDLTMETMRLTRNNPGLTASGWFEHMLFADSRGSSIRAPGDLHDLIVASYSGRNFSLDPATKLANFSLKNGDREVLAGSPGARDNPITVNIAENETATYQLMAKLSDGEKYQFKYPVTVKVFFRSGPLQGAIHWEGEESEPKTFVISQADELIPIDLKVSGKCDEVNREDGSCVDYAYIQIWNNDESLKKPVSKKRFYLRVPPSKKN